ncbi:hypothetical protein HMPREF1604_04988 [Escherichia coli 908519]|nr:hypothetical protein HMPREF1604_04988 [Escherichia coli 908519]
MIFCLPALASLSGKQPYSATFRATLAGPFRSHRKQSVTFFV